MQFIIFSGVSTLVWSGGPNYWVLLTFSPPTPNPCHIVTNCPSSTPKDLRFSQSFASQSLRQAIFLWCGGLEVSTKMRASFIKTRDLNVFTMSIVTAPWVWFLVCVIFGEGFMFQISFSSKTISKMNNMNTPIPSSVSQLSSDSCSFNNLPDWPPFPNKSSLHRPPGWIYPTFLDECFPSGLPYGSLSDHPNHWHLGW